MTTILLTKSNNMSNLYRVKHMSDVCGELREFKARAEQS